MTDIEFEKAIDICEKLDFFGGCRGGRELWFGKPADVQDRDIQKFAEDVAFLKDFIKRQKAEIEKLQRRIVNWREDMDYHPERERAEAIREFAEKIDQLLNRYSNLHKYADKARKSTEEYDDGTPIEMVSVWEVLSLKKWEMVDYETMSELQGNIETIAKERLLSELEKDFRLLVKEMTEETP